MGKLTMTTCDHCKKVVENPYKERGWIQLEASGPSIEKVSISRSTGVYGPSSSYDTDHLSAVTDFCSIVCLVAALDQKAREREDARAL